MEESLTDIERALRFSSDEAALRNTIVRLWFDLDQNPIEYAVEFGPNDHTVIPLSKTPDESNALTAEEYQKRQNQFDKKFNRVEEFQEKNKKFSDNIRVLGVGTSNAKKLISEGQVAIYIYPSGEKDESVIILGNDEEMVQLEIKSYGTDFRRKYYTFEEEGDIDKMLDERKKQAKGVFEKWLK